MKLRILLVLAITVPVVAPVVTAPAVYAEDWPMWARTPDRRMNSPEKNPPMEWDIDDGTNIKWSAQLGSQSYGNPIVKDGLVIVGTNNEAMRDSEKKGDAGVVKIFREKDGTFLWQAWYPKLKSGRVNDWPFQGVCSTSVLEGDFMWFANNRCEMICLDLSPLRKGTGDPKVVWQVDMMAKLGVFPHNMTSASPVIYKDYVYIISGNGVDATHRRVPAANAPSIIAFNKKTGEVKWTDGPDGPNILHGNWASPALTTLKNGKALVIAPLGDSWVYAYDAVTGKLAWKFDTNFKHTTYPSIRNELIATPVIADGLMYIATGQDPEHGEGPGIFWCIDVEKATKLGGDVSYELDGEAIKPTAGTELLVPTIGPKITRGKKNPNSAVVWHFTGNDANGDGRLVSSERQNRSIGTAAVADGMVFIMDFSGFMRCFDAKTGKLHWTDELEAATWSSPLIVDGKVYAADEDGDIAIYEVSKTKKKLGEYNVGSAVYTSPIFANGVLYVANRERLYAIQAKE